MIGLGDIVEKIIRVITFGQGKKLATRVAKMFGYEDCGCDRRQEKLNKFQIKIKRFRINYILSQQKYIYIFINILFDFFY